MAVTIAFEDGTVRLSTDSETDLDILRGLDAVAVDARSGTARAPAFRYSTVRDELRDRGIELADRITPVIDSDLGLSLRYELRPYQRDALSVWHETGQRGVIELPTGSGKTVVALAAIADSDRPTLVVVPTLDLLRQWRRELEAEFNSAVGQVGGGERRREPITVATYDSAFLRADEFGGEFGLVVFDEVHHLGGEKFREIPRLLVAPARLGLTATFERPDGAHQAIEDLIGPLVYSRDSEDLAGEHLADYEIRRIEVTLTASERERYERAQQTFLEYVRDAGLTFESGSDFQELVKRSGTDPAAREALLAKQRARTVMMNAERKVVELERILERHAHERTIVFTAHTDLVYELSDRFLMPAITNETGTPERREILQKFRDGDYSRIVTANVLDEGIDVPDAKVGVLLSGSGSKREFTQRLGRLLRPGEGKRAVLYELISGETVEESVADRRR